MAARMTQTMAEALGHGSPQAWQEAQAPTVTLANGQELAADDIADQCVVCGTHDGVTVQRDPYAWEVSTWTDIVMMPLCEPCADARYMDS